MKNPPVLREGTVNKERSWLWRTGFETDNFTLTVIKPDFPNKMNKSNQVLLVAFDFLIVGYFRSCILVCAITSPGVSY